MMTSVATREPVVAQLAILLCDEVERSYRVPSSEEFLRVALATMPDATLGEVKEAMRLYLSAIPANDDLRRCTDGHASDS